MLLLPCECHLNGMQSRVWTLYICLIRLSYVCCEKPPMLDAQVSRDLLTRPKTHAHVLPTPAATWSLPGVIIAWQFYTTVSSGSKSNATSYVLLWGTLKLTVV